jgi:hypothetical protein
LNRVHSSGRWALGCHWPKLSRCEKMRSLARAFSSSRRAPPIRASKAEFFNRFEQRDRLVHVAALARVGQAHGAAGHRVFDAAHDQFGPQFLGAEVAEIGHFREVVAGVDHQQRVGNAARAKRLLGALEHDQRVLAAREQQGGALEGGGDLAQDEDGFLFQRIQVGVAQALVLGADCSTAVSVRAFMVASGVCCGRALEAPLTSLEAKLACNEREARLFRCAKHPVRGRNVVRHAGHIPSRCAFPPPEARSGKARHRAGRRGGAGGASSSCQWARCSPHSRLSSPLVGST